jgi:succinate dehydrogenase / fumarate reductase membrane anchor subunit
MPDTPHIDILRSPLGRARGLGAAHHGGVTWWAHTLGSIALVPLTLWFICSMIRMVGATRQDVGEWLSRPVPLVLMLILLAITFQHMKHGLETVIEDYINQPAIRLASLLAIKGLSLFLGLACIVSALRIGL